MRYVIANWKMNMLLEDIKFWYSKFSSIIKKAHINPGIEIIISPTEIYIPVVKEVFAELPVKIASQDVSVHPKGAHTGYTSASQIKEYCSYTIVGHSERNEDLRTILKKRDRAIEAGLTPVVCFTKPEDCLKIYKKGSLIVWEDPNNISKDGVYRDKDPREIQTESKKIAGMLDTDNGLVYGGSVNKNNIDALAKMEFINGVLVGNASLDPEHFYEIISRFDAGDRR